MDMLTYVDESPGGPVIVVGAGVPASWSSHPMKTHGMLTKLGRVDWTWDGKTMLVKI
jgi:hypothetical protein